MTESEFASVVENMGRGEVLRMIDEEADPVVRALLARDMPKIVAAYVARSLALNRRHGTLTPDVATVDAERPAGPVH